MIPGARFIAWASGLVPFMRRRAWRREWEAEVAYAWTVLTRDGQPSWFAVTRLRIRVLSCVIDALWERKEMMTMTGLLTDFRLALRSLMRYPTFTAIAVLTLALGIGANTAVFTLVDGVLLSPLPFENADELIAIEHQGRDGRDELPMSQGLFILYGDEAKSLESIAIYAGSTVNLVSNGEPERIRVQAVSPSFFKVLGVGAALGRTYEPSEGIAPDGESTVILSDGMWRNTFGADPQIIGQSLDINGRLRQVVGVMPAGFGFPDQSARFWLPLQVDPARAPLAGFGPSAVARLAEGHSPVSALTEIEGLITRLPEFFPESDAVSFLQEVGLRPIVKPMKEALVGDMTSTLWILLGTVGFVLLIACANVANLLLVRAESRQRELALRVALGAGRMQLLRSFMSESMVLAGVGGLLGVMVASFAVKTSLAFVPTDIPRIDEVGVDMRVLGFTALIALGCAVFFGFFPMLRYGSDNLAGQLREGDSRGATGGRQRNRLRSGLVIVQMALAMVLLVGSGLMLRSFKALRAVDPGFDTERRLTAHVTVPAAEAADWAETEGFFQQLRERLEAQPGIESVGFAESVPLGSGVGYYSIEVEDHPRDPGALPIFASNNQVGVGYLETMGIDLLDGRTFQSGDGAEAARSVIVTQSFADHWWPGTSPLGRRMRLGFGPEEEWHNIVGVVADAHYTNLEDTPEEMVYWPTTVGPAADPHAIADMDIVFRTTTDPLQFVEVLRREVRALNARIPVSNPRTMESVYSTATARTSFTMVLLGAASGIALLLGLVGIYGVISYVVAQRTREIGVRMALGATAPAVRAMIVRQGMMISSIGVGVGLLAAGAMSSVMDSLLYGVSATDPLTYGSVSVALTAVALLASWLPALRAAGVDPSSALRSE